MQQHLQTLISLLQKNDLKAMLQHYLDSTEIQNTAQLGFMFQQGEIKSSHFDYFQQLATSFIEAKGLSNSLIAKIQTSNTLNFFTPALKLANNFKKTDEQQRNVLHYLFTNNKILTVAGQPPFNYLRSLMLFGSNITLCDGLCQRDKDNLTPIEAYLFTNKNVTPLANHELSALIALIEIEHKQQDVLQDNYSLFIKALNDICKSQAVLINKELQRILLIATYYRKPIQQVYDDINL
ncbi:hypothetical protein WNY51_09515 [Pseudocolwellia sp. AS88]|uniref:hypothetical protein n=1 Tax=Pseudocolwellia sp. AS88 TaxID=3063958 RepID=UPI0026EC8981|nr:hypothetical protein [Pseudocolwellia sp. AS88]MDO7084400.1 hypothetical protein [Pseudocolwellia sp. AS88]